MPSKCELEQALTILSNALCKDVYYDAPAWSELRALVQVLTETSMNGDGYSKVQVVAAQVKTALADALDQHFKPAFLLQGFQAEDTHDV